MNYILSILMFISVLVVNQKTHSFEINKIPGKIQLSVDPQETQSGGVDILFVIDNSGSMDVHQKNLILNLDLLISKIESENLNIGVLTTDTESEPQKVGTINWLSSHNNNWQTQLKTLLNVGVNGGAVESPLDAISKSLSEPALSRNKGFFRPNSDLVIVVVTDAEDHSHIQINDFANNLISFKGDKSNIGFHGIIIPSTIQESQKCLRDVSSELPKRIETVIGLFNGISASLCDSTMLNALSDIGTDIKNRTISGNLPIVLPLPLAPDLSTVIATYGSKVLFAGDLLYGWTFNSNTQQMIFGSKINWFNEAPGTKLLVTYVPEDWQK